ncbi:MAG: hypothetical protein F6K41_37805 [Symploca sp. SIO3E6]|nr:hypothetical protein [Caldora sp. SIO3E6]
MIEKTVALLTEQGIDYTTLYNLLTTEQWKEADKETARLMLRVAGREKKGWLTRQNIEQFPCADLYTIDQLWVHYSGGRFGFSVQKQIWENSRKNDSILTKCVGWRPNGNWLKQYTDFTFNTTAPLGHLPFYWWTLIHHFHFSSFATRLSKCAQSTVIQSIENKVDGLTVIKVGVPPDSVSDKYRKQQYQVEAKLEASREHIAELLEIIKLFASSMSENEKTENKFYAPVGSVSNKGNQTGFAGKVEGDLIGTQNNYPAEKQQTLAEAAEEIQNLLKQLEKTNPTATEVEQQGYVNALVPSNNKTKIVSALQAGWKEAIKELLDNPYLNVAIATLEGWQSVGK